MQDPPAGWTGQRGQTPDTNPQLLDYSSAQTRRLPRRWHLLLLSIFALGLAFVTAPAFLLHPRVRDPSPREKCASNLRQIGLATLMYANEHGGRFPDRLEDLLAEDINPDVFVCPLSNDTAIVAPTTQQAGLRLSAEPGHVSYIYVGKGLTDKADAKVLVAYERIAHHGDGLNMLFADGQVQFVPSAQAKVLIAQASSRPTTAATLP